MKQLISFFCFFLFASAGALAQQPHFIYLQTDNNQPFYVMLKNKNYSSSSFGYVILPKLENGDYRLKIGFAKSDMPEQDYVLKVKDNDQGYLIKNFGEKGNGIFNLQTLAVQYSGEVGRQLDAAANAQKEAERQKILLQQQKDSTEKAEAAAAEQRRIDNEAKLAAAAAKQKEDAAAQEKQRVEDSIKSQNASKIAAINQKKEAAALAKQQSLDSAKNAYANKLAIAKQKKEALALANQQKIDSIKAVNASKIAAAREKALAKHTADSIAKAANAAQTIAKAQPKTTETLAQKKARERIQHVSDSLKMVEKNRLQAEQDAAEQHKQDEAILAKQKADEQARIEAQQKQDAMAAQKKAADDLQRKNDSLAMMEKNRLAAEKAVAQKDSSALVANSNNSGLTTNTTNATIVYEPKVLNRLATDSGTILTYTIPSSKGWDTVTAFIKDPVAEKKQIAVEKPIEQKPMAENNSTTQADSTKFLDMHFKQDSAAKSGDLITPVFKEDKPVKTTAAQEAAPAKTQEVGIAKNTATNSAIAATTPIANSNCRAEANDKDFYALRKKMVAQNDADNMIIVAKKSMREKCYNTQQIRNLSVLLITDADRYQFLEAAYPFTSDAYNYGSLADLLKDNYYGDRFKVMLKR